MTDDRNPSEFVLTATQGMPERTLEPGQVLFTQGDGGVEVAVLVNGSLGIDLSGTRIETLRAPGTFVGELAALLGTARTADVVAAEPSTVRVIGDPSTFFASHPEVGLELARQLAGRLQRLLAYLGDLRRQYAGSNGHLALVDSVLGKLASRTPVDIQPGSDRSPDY